MNDNLAVMLLFGVTSRHHISLFRQSRSSFACPSCWLVNLGKISLSKLSFKPYLPKSLFFLIALRFVFVEKCHHLHHTCQICQHVRQNRHIRQHLRAPSLLSAPGLLANVPKLSFSPHLPTCMGPYHCLVLLACWQI